MNQKMDEITPIVSLLNELMDDTNVPKNVRASFEDIITILDSNDDNSVKVHEALNILDSVSNDVNLESFTRTQVWSVVSMLEKLG